MPIQRAHSHVKRPVVLCLQPKLLAEQLGSAKNIPFLVEINQGLFVNVVLLRHIHICHMSDGAKRTNPEIVFKINLQTLTFFGGAKHIFAYVVSGMGNVNILGDNQIVASRHASGKRPVFHVIKTPPIKSAGL